MSTKILKAIGIWLGVCVGSALLACLITNGCTVMPETSEAPRQPVIGAQNVASKAKKRLNRLILDVEAALARAKRSETEER